MYRVTDEHSHVRVLLRHTPWHDAPLVLHESERDTDKGLALSVAFCGAPVASTLCHIRSLPPLQREEFKEKVWSKVTHLESAARRVEQSPEPPASVCIPIPRLSVSPEFFR